MSLAEIHYRDRPSADPELWAQKEGTKTEVRESARDLLQSMREDGQRSCAVFIVWPNGRRERVRVKKGA